MDVYKSPLINQIFVASGILSAILSCGLGLGFLASILDQNLLENNDEHVEETSLRYIETAGEIAFVPSIVIIPFIMQKKGRKSANFMTILPLLFSWLISFDANHFIGLMMVNILHNVALGGVVTISSVIISEFCSPKYRGTFLMLETAMISLGVLLSHTIGNIFSCWRLISTLGTVSALVSLIITYFWPESPYWLISQGHMVKCTESFHWLRGRDEEAIKELDSLLITYRLNFQLKALKPIMKLGIQERTIDYLKSLLKADFLKPLSIMILLFSFVGFGGDNVASSYSFRDIFKLTNGKYVGTILLDVLTLVCSLTACVIIHIVKRKTLFLFTSSISIIFLGLTTLFIFLQIFDIFTPDYMWLFLSLVTGFVMFMSLGTSALPFSLLGEIFPMSYKGIGSSLTCAYLWAFGNSILKLVPTLTWYIGIHGVLLAALISMILILTVVNKILPETNNKTLMEIEQLMNLGGGYSTNEYEIVSENYQEGNNNFDRLKLFIEV